MAEWVSGLLESDLKTHIPLLLKALFFAALFFAVLALYAASFPGKKVKVNYVLLGWIFCGALLAVLLYQATWQLGGMARPEFVKYMRTYNRRSNVARQQSLRGPILDRRGMVLAAPRAGSIWERRYPLGAAGVHPLGYYHPRYGITAVERVCDGELSGVIQDREALARSLIGRRSEQGGSVGLTLDARLQKKAYELLRGRGGAVVALDPRNGDILALASAPGFDPARPESAIRDARGKPLFNRAVQGRYPPGSTFKIVTAGAALSAGISPTYHCPAGGFVAAGGARAIRDSEYYSALRRGKAWRGWGELTMKEAMVHSSNVYFSQLGAHCAEAVLSKAMRDVCVDIGFTYMAGESGGIDSASGEMPTLNSEWKRAQAAIGQGDLLLTPLHVACYTAAAANGGALYAPRLNGATPVRKLAQPFTPAAAYTLKVMLREVIVRGTGRAADLKGLDVCGKTGTAQVGQGQDHAWFTCFAPFAEPEIVVTVLIEHGGFGAAAALPVARDLLAEAERLELLGGTKRGRR